MGFGFPSLVLLEGVSILAVLLIFLLSAVLKKDTDLGVGNLDSYPSSSLSLLAM